MSKQISEARKVAYYAGMVLTVGGLLLFGSVFVTAATSGHAGGFDGPSMMGRAFGGIVVILIGGVLRTIGARGLAGAGVVLDPKRARRDLEPYSRMGGGMLKDALDEADVDLGGPSEKVVMVKCRACGKLNEEDSKFCQECGQGI